MLTGQMQDRPLLISSLIEHAAKFHPLAEIVSRTAEGPIHRTHYGEICRRSKQLAQTLTALRAATPSQATDRLGLPAPNQRLPQARQRHS
jgi:acyl-CoA synthetase (AMP-forming)/AMP-acid ligase II